MRYTLTTVALLSACALSQPQSPPEPPFGTLATWDSLRTPVTLQAILDGEDSPPAYAHFRVMHGKTGCHNKLEGQGNPLVHCRNRPMVGVPHRVGWTVNPSGPYDEQRPAYLMVWFDEASPTDLTPFGYDGCTMFGPLKPRQLHTIVPGNNSPLTQHGGQLELNWTPPATWLGKSVFCQLVVWSPGSNQANWLLSPALKMVVGNR